MAMFGRDGHLGISFRFVSSLFHDLHFQPRKQFHILCRHSQFQQHDAIHALPQVLRNRRPWLGSRLPRRPESELDVLDLMVVQRRSFGEEVALEGVVL